MSIGSESDPPAMEHLSALVDGELDARAAARICADWRDDAVMRSTWHAYQMIGDVLRSDDLANHAAHDASFLLTLRARLAAEPTVLAPQAPIDVPVAHPAVANARGGRWGWMAPSAVAAGFVLVAGAVMVTRGPLSGSGSTDAAVVAGASPVAVPASTLAAQEQQVAPRSFAPNGKLIRDARLDRYLAAHQQFAGTSALGVPSGFLRHAAAVEAPSR